MKVRKSTLKSSTNTRLNRVYRCRERVASWGTLKPDTLSLEKIASERKHASEIMDRVGFDQGARRLVGNTRPRGTAQDQKWVKNTLIILWD